MSQREDILVNYTEPTSSRSLSSLLSLQGVEHVEGFRAVPARLRYQHRSYRTSVQGIESKGELLRLLDSNLKEIELSPEGVVMTDYLAELLHIKPGDLLTIEVLEGNRPVVQVPVIGTAKQDLGINVYLQRDNLNRLLKEGDVVTGKIVHIADFGVFLEIKPGVEGLIHVSEIDKEVTKKSLTQFYPLGSEIQAKIINLKVSERRLGLSVIGLSEANYRQLQEKGVIVITDNEPSEETASAEDDLQTNWALAFGLSLC